MRCIAFAIAALLAFAHTAQAQDYRPPILSEKWIKQEAQLRFASWDRKIYGVNAFLNANPHEMGVEDGVSYVKEGSRSTSCMDYARAKKQMLKNLGIESEIVVVRLRKAMPGEQKAIHAYVLVQGATGAPVGLDNRFRDPVGPRALQAAYEPQDARRAETFTINEMLAREKQALTN